jgi:hypothetical protein
MILNLVDAWTTSRISGHTNCLLQRGFSLFLLALFIQNSLSSNDLDVTITGIDVESAGCLPEDPTYGPVFIFYLQIIETGFPVTEEGTKWIIKLDDPYAFATCWIYGNNGKEQKTACTVNLLLTPLKQVKFPAQYSHYDQSYTWTVTGWDKLASKVVFDKSCYPNYLYSFIPSAETREEVDCNSKYNQVTIYGKFEKTSQAQSLRRLSTDVDLEFSPYLIVDGQLSQAKCAYSSLNEANSSEVLRRVPLGVIQRKHSDKEVDLTYEMDAVASYRWTGEDSGRYEGLKRTIDSIESEVTRMLDIKNSEK